MKTLLSHLIVLSAGLTATATAAAATAEDVRIHTFDIKPETSSLKSERRMSLDGAWSLLKRRLGGSEAASSPLPDRIDEETVETLNELGGQHAFPFGEVASSEDRRLLLILEGVNSEDVDLSHTSASNDVVIPRGSIDFMRDFSINDLLSQTPNDESHLCSNDLPFGDDVQANIMTVSLDGCPPVQDGFTNLMPAEADEALTKAILAENESMGSPKHSRIAMRFSSTDKSPFPKEYISKFPQALKTLADEHNFESTLILLPGHLGKSNYKRSPTTHHRAQKRNINVNAMKHPSGPIHARSSHPISPIRQPICHSTNDTCMEKTGGCSGHGTCYLKHTISSKSSEKDGSCYACKCARTVVRTNDDGTVKTAQWGGPTCSKRDVSMPFFLIGGFSILLVLAIGYGISLLFSIGTEELPSVLSAGVAPPRGQR